MHLYIDGPNGTILLCGTDSPNVLIPLDKAERVLAFNALVDALALLTGITPQMSSDATAIEPDQSNPQNSQCFDDHTSGVVVPLIMRPAAQAVLSKRDKDSRDG